MTTDLKESFDTHYAAIIHLLTFEKLEIPHTSPHGGYKDAGAIKRSTTNMRIRSGSSIDWLLISFIGEIERESSARDYPNYEKMMWVQELGVILDGDIYSSEEEQS
ncbi:hypothetical protein N7457_004125 [Penicillium paradoxum]|uniref:uncharacterized protein n=1 Tax=Penicillium paradoxum TaxID=176176 RepID=UPI002546C03E|nr:uncharacterized protein N7457_004125 [Penicillium paradoxum]KAJ5782351.1 hypothetical protein N7457_004125 [Penicillium paradoxum]